MNAADTSWMLISTALVLLMTPALAFFYGGLVRSKNALNTMMMSFVSLGFVGVLWAIVGYSIAFAPGDGVAGDLSRVLLEMVHNHDRFTPREWVMQEMSCQKGAEVLGEHIGQVATKLGERWSAPLVAKFSALSGMRYWDPADRGRFEQDYAFLESMLRK